ncbi:MAG: DNA alkylation repair protein [Clostridia bacterium]|nr:DNA alkylation repair protein [Clostridia bacterium]
MNKESEVRSRLFEYQDLKYRDFNSKLIPTVNKDRIIGVRTPVLRKLAKEFNKADYKDEFLKALPHKYYEEDNLHAFLIEQIKDFDECIFALDNFLLYIDNWATCDMMTPKVLGKEPEKLYYKIQEWVNSSHTYTVRFSVVTLMKFFMNERLDKKHLNLLLTIKSDEYYINMAIAWYLATALACNWDMVIPYIEKKKFNKWVHNKAIQKAIESYRITPEQKTYLKTLKIK